MAVNEYLTDATQIEVEVGENVKAGDPVLFGKLPGVALTASDANKFATVKFGGAFKIVVYGWKKETKEEELEIKPGEPVYLKETGKPLSGASGNTLFGFVIEKVTKKEETAKIVKIATP